MTIRAEFKAAMLNPSGKAKAVAISEAFSTLLDRLEAAGLIDRDLALVKAKLAEACAHAQRGVASLPANQE